MKHYLTRHQTVEVLEAFLKEASDRRSTFMTTGEARDSQTIEIEAHALKSSARNVGLIELGERSKQLEYAAATDNKALIVRTASAVIEIVEPSIEALMEFAENEFEYVSDRSCL